MLEMKPTVHKHHEKRVEKLKRETCDQSSTTESSKAHKLKS